MVEAGMPPLAAFKAATIEAANLLGAEKEIGTVETGKFADLAAVPGDVLEDIKLDSKVNFVMKRGQIYKQYNALSGWGQCRTFKHGSWPSNFLPAAI